MIAVSIDLDEKGMRYTQTDANGNQISVGRCRSYSVFWNKAINEKDDVRTVKAMFPVIKVIGDDITSPTLMRCDLLTINGEGVPLEQANAMEVAGKVSERTVLIKRCEGGIVVEFDGTVLYAGQAVYDGNKLKLLDKAGAVFGEVGYGSIYCEKNLGDRVTNMQDAITPSVPVKTPVATEKVPAKKRGRPKKECGTECIDGGGDDCCGEP